MSALLTQCHGARTQAHAALQGGSQLGTHKIPQPAGNAKLTSATFRHQQLICLWSTGLLQAYNTAASITSGKSAFKLQTSRQLLGFASPADEPFGGQPQQLQQPKSKPGKEPKSGKKRRQSTAPIETVDLPPSASQPAPFRPVLIPLGSHSIAAIREAAQVHTNGQQSFSLEVAITDSLYGCVQSVATIKLPKSAAAAVGVQHGAQQQALQLQTGMGDLALLFNDAVWSISAKVSLTLCWQ